MSTTEFSVPAPAQTFPYENLGRIPFANADRDPSRPVVRRLVDGAWHPVTAADYRDEIRAVAKGLLAKGVRPGDRVVLMSHTRYEWSLVAWAIWAAGAVCVPIYETSSADQCNWILTDSAATLAVAEDEELRSTLTGESDWDGEVLVIADGAVDALVAAGRELGDEAVEQSSTAAGLGELASLIYTSGTTGRPKGCEILHGGFGRVIMALEDRLGSAFTDDANTLIFLPLAHVLARILEVTCFYKGAVISHEPDASRVVERLPEVQPTFLVSVPRVLEKVYNSAAGKAEDAGGVTKKIFTRAVATAVAYSEATADGGHAGPLLSARRALYSRLVYRKLHVALGGHCDRVISGGGPLGTRLGHFFHGAGFDLLEGYGLTESSGVVSVNPLDGARIGSVGIPIPGMSLRIDAESGEVLAKAESLFHGYWKNDEANREAWEDGWFRTGDLGEIDDDGYLYITGRSKDLIVTAGGKNVSPSQLEDVLAAHPLISQAMVVGDNRSFIAALVTIDPETFEGWKRKHGKSGSVADNLQDGDLVGEVQDAVDKANRTVSRAESIRKFEILPGEFTVETGELTPTLKLKRKVVTEKHGETIEALYDGRAAGKGS